MFRPDLGQKIIAVAVVEKDKQGEWSRRKTVWNRYVRGPINGIYIGYRTVYDGYREVEEEYGAYFQPISHQEVWLIVTDPRRKPVYVLPTDCLMFRIGWNDGVPEYKGKSLNEILDGLLVELGERAIEMGLPLPNKWVLCVRTEQQKQAVITHGVTFPVRVVDWVNYDEFYVLRAEDVDQNDK